MKVYLAGKMDAENGSWRDGILGSVYDYTRKRPIPCWEIVRTIGADYVGDELDMAGVCWPRNENRLVLGLHDYVGPYRMTFSPDPQSKHSGYFHGSTARGQHGQMDDDDQMVIVRECRYAIKRADFVFAYLNSPDCFGTLAEIGVAAAIGTYVHVVVAEEASWEWNDYWFIGEMVNQITHDMKYDREAKESEQERVRRLFQDALVTWTGRSVSAPTFALVQSRSEESAHPTIAREAAQSFSQIARWSADPRVRDEAQRMLRRITG